MGHPPSGSVAESYTYDSYGKLIAGGTTIVNPFRYTGREWDESTGLYYHRARSYQGETGRFMSEDPIEFNGGINFYAYVSNLPTLFRDPDGLQKRKAPPIKTPIAEKVMDVLRAGPIDTARAKKIADETLQRARDIGLPGIHNGKADAWRHCVLACRLSREINPSAAEAILDEHEIQGKNAVEEELMDRANNDAGLECAKWGPTWPCEAACLNKLNNRRLYGPWGMVNKF